MYNTNLDEGEGGLISVDSTYYANGSYNHDKFDGLVYSEVGTRQYRSGSEFWNRGNRYDGPPETNNETYMHFALVYDSNGDITLYRNATQYGDVSSGNNIASFVANTTKFIFCQRHTGTHTVSNPFNISYIAYYDVALNQSDIISLYCDKFITSGESTQSHNGLCPTMSPTTMPSFEPTIQPSNEPSIPPTSKPSSQPTSQPNNVPTDVPTNFPTEIGSTNVSSSFISNDDIQFAEFFASSVKNNSTNSSFFNPGFRNEFFSIIEVELVGEWIVSLFDDWYNNNSTAINMSLVWNVFNDSGEFTGDEINFDTQLISISKYNADNLEKFNQSYAIFSVESYFVLYSSQSINTLSHSICSAYDENYFISGNYYTFQNKITFELNDAGVNNVSYVSQSKSLTLQANSPPTNGTCIANVDSGTSSAESSLNRYNISCFGWIDPDSIYNAYDLKFNFIYDNLVFLKNSYDITRSMSTNVGIGNVTITAVILDENLLASCLNVSIFSTFDDAAFENYTIAQFSDWITDIYDTNNTNSNNSNIVSELSVTTDIVFDLTIEYLDQALNESSQAETQAQSLEVQSELAELQTIIIESYIESVDDHVDTPQEASTVIAVLSKVTVPIVNTSANIDYNRTANKSTVVYETTLISDVLEIVDDPLIAVLQQSVESGELDAVDADTAQYTFGMLICFSCFVDFMHVLSSFACDQNVQTSLKT